MRFIELFAGIGGFRYGLEAIHSKDGRLKMAREADKIRDMHDLDSRGAGGSEAFTCVWANEWDKYACQIYRRNYGQRVCVENERQPKEASLGNQKRQSGKLSNPSSEGQYDCPELYEGDITRVDTKDIPDHDLLVGGFPCQAFSIAGNRLGFADIRGTLFFEIVRILRDKKPRCVLLENVKGLLSHDSGKTFQVILKTLSDIGYRVEWQLLNSKHYGVPQNRERVFIVGHLRGRGRQQVFPLGQDGAISGGKVRPEQGRPQTEVSHTLKGSNVKADNAFIVHNIYGGFKEKEARVFDDVAPTVRTPQGGGHIPNVVKGMKIRRLTPTECERLQGFPDGWTEGISDSQRYKCLGNAVTTNVITAIGEKLWLKSQL